MVPLCRRAGGIFSGSSSGISCAQLLERTRSARGAESRAEPYTLSIPHLAVNVRASAVSNEAHLNGAWATWRNWQIIGVKN